MVRSAKLQVSRDILNNSASTNFGILGYAAPCKVYRNRLAKR